MSATAITLEFPAPNRPAIPLHLGQRALYVFCCTRPEVRMRLEGDALEPGQRLFAVQLRDVAAVACEVQLQDWVGTNGETHLDDPRWLVPRVRRHDQIVEGVMAKSPLLPLPVGTLFSSEGRLVTWLSRRRSRIDQFLRVIADKEEWSMRGILDCEIAESYQWNHDPQQQHQRSLGMHCPPNPTQRQEALLRACQAAKKAEATLFDRLSGLMLVRTIRRVAPRRNSEAAHQVMFHSSLLIPESSRAAVRAAVAEFNFVHARRGFVVELGGPWPPSSFAPSLVPSLDDRGGAGCTLDPEFAEA